MNNVSLTEFFQLHPDQLRYFVRKQKRRLAKAVAKTRRKLVAR